MAVDAGAPLRAAPLPPVPLLSRVYGLGSIYGKTIRDSRLAFIIVAGLLGGMTLAVSGAIAAAYTTPAARTELARLATDMSGIAQGIAGKAVNVGTMGGYVQWKYGPVLLFVAALWSILALSSTLASEARRGSLDFVAAAPFGKRRIAIEKVAAHVTLITIAAVILALAAWLAGAALGTLPDDGFRHRRRRASPCGPGWWPSRSAAWRWSSPRSWDARPGPGSPAPSSLLATSWPTTAPPCRPPPSSRT